jgi:hypothetical protein
VGASCKSLSVRLVTSDDKDVGSQQTRTDFL